MKILKSEDFLMVKKLKKYVKKYYILIILNILLALVSSAVSATPVTLIKRLFDRGIQGKDEKDILYAAGGMILLSVLGAFLVYWTTILSGKISSSIYKNIVDDLYVKIQSLDMEYFSTTKVGELMTKVLNDPANVNTFILEFFEFLKYVFTAISYLVIAIRIDWKLTLGMFIVAPILMTTVKKYSKKTVESQAFYPSLMTIIIINLIHVLFLKDELLLYLLPFATIPIILTILGDKLFALLFTPFCPVFCC